MFKERIKALRKKTGLTLAAFGERIGIGRDAYANLEYGRVDPSEIVIRTIVREFGVDYGWIKDGTGEMFASEEDEVMAALDDLMTGESHEKTKAMIKALAKMTDEQLDAIDCYIDALVKELGH